MTNSDAPALEMLWEPHNPQSALDKRFGFTDEKSAANWVAATLDEHWDVQIRACERIVISDHNALAWVDTPSGRLLAKWSVVKSFFPRLAEIARLTHWLETKGIPVSVPLPAQDGRLQVEVDGASMSLQRKINADLLDTTDPSQVQAAGAVLARLQNALATYPEPNRVAASPGPSAPLRPRITNWLDSHAEHLPPTARDTLRHLLSDAPSDQLPTQLVHHDFRAANVLCTGAEVAAVIDFEETTFDHRVVELARSAILLGTRFHDWGPVPPEVHAAFLEGYESVRRLSPVEAGWWEILLRWYALAMVPPGDDPTGWGPAALSHFATTRPRRR